LLARYYPIIAEAVNLIADQQVRNRGTIGGCIAHADPSGDLPAVILALKAEIVAQGPKGARTIPIDDFLVGTFTTALEPDEIVTAIRFPIPAAHTGSAYEKLANRASHYAVVGSAAVVTLGGDGTCTSASVAITGASTEITRASAVEAALVGKKLDEATLTEAASHAPEGLELISDIHGSEAYRRQMTSVITRRALARALERA
jgi:carbon-monoxide dehydrogenase medium subunit